MSSMLLIVVASGDAVIFPDDCVVMVVDAPLSIA